MTTAVCIHCGDLKFGAFNKCSACGHEPTSDDEFIRSLALSDHFFSGDDLRKMSANISSGQEIEIDDAFYAVVRDAWMTLLDKKPKTGKKRGFFSSLFGQGHSSEKLTSPPVPKQASQPTPPTIRNLSGLNWTFVLERIRKSDLQLVGKKRAVKIPEMDLGGILVVAKINGWTGGEHFFDIDIAQGQGVLREFQDGMSIYGDEAAQLGVKFSDFKKTYGEGEAENEDHVESFLQICAEGGFFIMRNIT